MLEEPIEMIAMPSLMGSLDAYINAVYNIPTLSEAEEKALANRYWESKDIAAANKLVTSHLRYVVRIARMLAGYNLPLGDLIQEGNIGLMKAVEHFDPNNGARLTGFAVRWIRSEMYEYIIKNWRIIKMATTKEQRKLFFNMRKSKKRSGWMNAAEVTALAIRLGVSEAAVREMEGRFAGVDVGFTSENDDEEDARFSPDAFLFDEGANPYDIVAEADAEEIQNVGLSNAMRHLDDRSRDILQSRWLAESKTSLQDLAEKYGVSAERIRQIETAAMKKLRLELEPAL